MLTSLNECGVALSNEDIAFVENRIGVLLPSDYRTFLLKHNGGRPHPNAFLIEGFENNPFGTIQMFLRINGENKSSNVDWTYDTMNGRLPSNLLAIARTDGGDLVCYSLFGDDAGSVVFWDFYAESETPSYANVYRIADSFSEFINSIQEVPESQNL